MIHIAYSLSNDMKKYTVNHMKPFIFLFITTTLLARFLQLSFDPILPTIVHASILAVESTTEPPTLQSKLTDAFPHAYSIAMCESSLNPTAKNQNSSASGLFQIIRGTWSEAGCTGDVFNEDDNIVCAKRLYDKQGLKPWKASKGCWSK